MSGASIYSLAEGGHAKLESAHWARFTAPASMADFCSSWLAILCGQVERVQGGLVLLGPGEDGSYSPVASWPDAGHNLLHLGPAAVGGPGSLPGGGGGVFAGISGLPDPHPYRGGRAIAAARRSRR